jgi:sec-independent protein translocase protein TatA
MLGTAEILVILCIVLLLFGGKKLPELARSLGKGIREFKQATQGATEDTEVVEHKKVEPPQQQPSTKDE